MRPLPAHSLAAAVALAFFVFAKSLLMRNARSKTLLFFPAHPKRIGFVRRAEHSDGARKKRRASHRQTRSPPVSSSELKNDSLEPTEWTGRSMAPERIWLLSNGARLSRGCCPPLLLPCFFLRLLRDAALCDHRRWLVHGPYWKRF
jgi:hypothetical protein